MTDQTKRRKALEEQAKAAAKEILSGIGKAQESEDEGCWQHQFVAWAVVDFALAAQQEAIEACAGIAGRYGRDDADLHHPIVYQAADKIAKKIRALAADADAGKEEPNED